MSKKEQPLRCLIFTDIHAEEWKLKKLEEISKKADIILSGGDLLYALEPTITQAQRIQRWAETMGKPFHSAEGNHDYLWNDREDEEIGQLLQNKAHWFEQIPNCAGLGTHESKIKGHRLLITTTPWEHTGATVESREAQEAFLWGLAASRRKQQKPTWIVLKHDPPAGSKLAGPDSGSEETQRLTNRFQPDVLICGHIHTAPFESNQCHQQMGRTLVINTGNRPNTLTYAWLIISKGAPKIIWKKIDQPGGKISNKKPRRKAKKPRIHADSPRP